MVFASQFIYRNPIRKTPWIRNYYTVIVDTDLDFGTGHKIIPVNEGVDNRFTQGLDRVILDLPALHCRERFVFPGRSFKLVPDLEISPEQLDRTFKLSEKIAFQ